LLVITSVFHLPRTQAIFGWIFTLDSPAPAYDLHFIAVPDVGLPPGALAARQEKERRSLQDLQNPPHPPPYYPGSVTRLAVQ
jgi:hypothetical protein